MTNDERHTRASPRRGRFGVRLWGAIALLAGVWAALAALVVPTVIRAIHAGRGPRFLWRLMPGHDGTQVDDYIALWYQLNRVTVAYAGALILLTALVLSLRHAFRTNPGTASPHVEGGISTIEILLLLSWFGLVTGLGESYFLMAKTWLWQETVPGFRAISKMSLWMAPMAMTTVTLVVGLVVLPLRRWRPQVAGIRSASFIGTTMLVLTLIMMTGRVHWVAGALLALGVAINLSRSMARHATATMALVRASLPVLIGIVVVLGLGERWYDGWRERRALAALPPAPAGPHPSVLWIVLDTERTASMSLYGFDRPTTPFLERLAERAVVFDWAIAAESWTLPSHGTMFTSHFNTDLRSWTETPLDDTYRTVAEVLRDYGYLTAGFSANLNFVTDERHGLDRGFDHWSDQPLSLAMVTASSWLSRNTAVGLRELTGLHTVLPTKSADVVVDEFLAWRTQATGRPYMAFLNFFDAHSPYRPVATPYLPTSRPNGRYWLQGLDDTDKNMAEVRVDLRENYEASIAYLDSRLQRLFQTLKAHDELENTLVIIASDHGEQFGEHGKMDHGNSLYLPLLHVPLLIIPPRPLHQGLRITEAVSLADLPATAVSIAGLQQGPFLGASLARFWDSDAPPGQPSPAFAGTWDVSLVSDGWHYIRTRDGEELYHLATDPEELHNVAEGTEPPEALHTLRRQVDSLLATSRSSHDGVRPKL